MVNGRGWKDRFSVFAAAVGVSRPGFRFQRRATRTRWCFLRAQRRLDGKLVVVCLSHTGVSPLAKPTVSGRGRGAAAECCLVSRFHVILTRYLGAGVSLSAAAAGLSPPGTQASVKHVVWDGARGWHVSRGRSLLLPPPGCHALSLVSGFRRVGWRQIFSSLLCGTGGLAGGVTPSKLSLGVKRYGMGSSF